jgi:hypothetical protein
MRNDKNHALNFRKNGKSYSEIKTQLGVPKSTLSGWFKDQKWSADLVVSLTAKANEQATVRIRELDRIRGEHLKRLYIEAELEAIEEFLTLKHHPLFIAGLVIYWGEGNKVSRGRCWIANTDPAMIKIFVQFLKNICQIEPSRIKAWVLLYPDLDEETCLNYWRQYANLTNITFNKSIKIKGSDKIKKLSFGVCNVGVSSSYLKKKIIKWIELLGQDLSGEKKAGIV